MSPYWAPRRSTSTGSVRLEKANIVQAPILHLLFHLLHFKKDTNFVILNGPSESGQC